MKLLIMWSFWVVAFAAAGAESGATLPRSSRITPTVRAVSRVLPSVVNISTQGIVVEHQSRDPFARWIEEYFSRSVRPNALGSGVIVDESGLILTNEHVIRRAAGITVTLADGHDYEAFPVAINESADLALLRINGIDDSTPLQAIEFAAPDDLFLGETVISVGNPFGLGHSIAVGVLSATGREIEFEGGVRFDDMLQIDAPINSGNSGGPLVNVDGQLIGVSLAVHEGAQGIGFGIPIKAIEALLSMWLMPSRFRLVNCGVVPATRILDNGQTAVVVREVLGDSPAAASGLKVGDIIESVNGVPVRQAIEAGRILWRLDAGQELRLTLAGGREVSVPVVPTEQLNGVELARKKLGVELQELTPPLAHAMRLRRTHGLVVSDVSEGSVVARRGLKRGDVIVKVGEVPITKFQDLVRAFTWLHHGDVATIIIHRLVPYYGRQKVFAYRLTVPF